MMKKTHLLFGILFFIVATIYFDFRPELGIFALIGAMIPDLDLGFMHRKLLHNLFALLGFNLLFWYYGLGTIAITVFSLGYISHLVADSMTEMGVSWFYPFRQMHIEGGIRTGGIGEFVLSVIILVIIIAILYGIDQVFALKEMIPI